MGSNSICRTCLIDTTETTSLKNVIKLDGNEIMLCEILFQCTSLEIQYEDNISDVICKSCVGKLSIAFSFRQQCLEADSLIKKLEAVNGEEKFNVESLNEFHDEQSDESEIKVCISTTEIDQLEEFLSSEYHDIPERETETEYITSKQPVKRHLRPKSNSKHRRRIISQPGNKKSEWLCPLCGAVFNTRNKFYYHTIAVHEPEKKRIAMYAKGTGEFPCPTCNKILSSKARLNLHMNLHNPDNKFKCEICNEMFMANSYLEIHRMRKHTNIKKHFCEICGKGTINKHDMNIHMRFHTGLKSYICHVCSKAFYTSSHLSEHLRLHVSEALYECAVCNKKFIAPKHLKRHMETHSKRQCTMCPRTFTLNKTLLAHMLTHTGESLSVCQICGKKFVKKVDYTNHVNLAKCKPKQ